MISGAIPNVSDGYEPRDDQQERNIMLTALAPYADYAEVREHIQSIKQVKRDQYAA